MRKAGEFPLLAASRLQAGIVLRIRPVNPNIGGKWFVGEHVHNRPPGCYLSHQGHAVLSSAKAI